MKTAHSINSEEKKKTCTIQAQCLSLRLFLHSFRKFTNCTNCHFFFSSLFLQLTKVSKQYMPVRIGQSALSSISVEEMLRTRKRNAGNEQILSPKSFRRWNVETFKQKTEMCAYFYIWQCQEVVHDSKMKFAILCSKWKKMNFFGYFCFHI